MSIERRVQLVEKLFFQLDQESVLFKKSSGLSCVVGCGRCCSTPTVEASPLEFLPWAFHLFLNDEEKNTLALLNQTQAKTCILYKSLTSIHRKM